MELRFKIKEIPQLGAPKRVRIVAPADLLAEVLEGSGGEVANAAVTADLDLSRDQDEVLAFGTVFGKYVLPCARCVEPADVPIDTRLDLVFSRQLPESRFGRDEPASDEDDDDEPSVLDQPDHFQHDGNYIVLDAPLRELLIAELPISPLCKPDCLGLCPVCGANKNTLEGQACGHAVVEDPDFGAPGLGALRSVKLSS